MKAYQVLHTGQDLMEVRISLCSALCVCSQYLTFREYATSQQKQNSLCVAGTYIRRGSLTILEAMFF